MKLIKKYGIIFIILTLIISSAWIVCKEQIKKQDTTSFQSGNTPYPTEEMLDVANKHKENNYWKNVLSYLIQDNYSYLEHNDKISLYHWDDEIINIGYEYHLGDIQISKSLPKDCVIAVDYGEHIFDDEYTLVNDYSYLYIPVRIINKRTQTDEFYGLNTLYLFCFDASASFTNGIELAGAKSTRSKRLKSFFIYTMEPGKVLDTGLLYIVPDKAVTKNSGLVLNICNTGGMVDNIADTCLVKVPFGKGLE